MKNTGKSLDIMAFEYEKAKIVTDDFSVNMSSYNLVALLKKENTQKQKALITGKLITLFDEPNIKNNYIGNLYTYYIITKLSGGSRVISPLIVSFWENGISILTKRHFHGLGTMFGLVNKICLTIPSNYEMTFKNEKISADIFMGVKNGLAYYETVYNKK